MPLLPAPADHARSGRRRRRALAGALCLLLAGAGSACRDDDGDFPDDGPRQSAQVTLTQVAAAQSPTAGVTGLGDTVWIAERAGRVRVLTEGGLGEPVLDISPQTTTDGERGLLGITFDPTFSHLYLSYTDLSGDTVIDEIALTDGRPRPETRRTVLTQEQPYANHNGGDLTFGPDGMLYIGLGDGGSGGDPHNFGQDLSTLLGKLLRIDPAAARPYGIPPDNPFVDRPGARGEIWAYGLRNPWRFSFDAETGDLWIADVGQSSREEIDRAPAGTGAGANYGWSRMEGTRVYSGEEPADHVPPVFEYSTGERCSITGGYVYRGEAIPHLRGAYVFSDYCAGDLWALDLADGEVTGVTDLGVNGGAVVGFVQGPDRELYVLDLGGTVYRIDPAG
ncbi:MAG TPA: PQQ-dependent sugar dehydrogenase [Natronosporangium sp.]|nr:PQQ-dependent sugar dehydrogenase [Natronosporangium sp.]